MVRTHWVGSTDLEIEFVVTEAGSGGPVPGARVEVHSEGRFSEEPDKGAFVLVADAGGVARKECLGSTCFGTRSALGFTDTYVVGLPWWRFRVVAPGFEPCDWLDLDLPEHVRQVQRVRPHRARLVIPVSLHKSRG
jgi:hypothetical protein